MKHLTGFFAVLAALWLMLSGVFEPLLLSLGLLSCLFVLFIAHRMDVIDHEGRVIHLGFVHLIFYWLWLVGEIVKASIDVTRRVLDPALPIRPTVIRLKATQPSEMGLVIYANSITLTPGTVSIDVTAGEIKVHALTAEAAADLEKGEMDRRITRLEASD